MMSDRLVFYISDGTGITAETIGHSLLTQFEGIRFHTQRFSFVDSEDKARDALRQIQTAAEVHGCRPIIISSVVDESITGVLEASGGLILDVFGPFIGRIEAELGKQRERHVGHAHGMVDFAAYEARINATNYALTHDDGGNVNYNEADLILVGVSRSGKTPTCLYLALHYGVRAANYPLTEDDLADKELPKRLQPYRKKIYGLTIDPVRLRQIRQERKPDSRYATIEQCRMEVAAAEAMFKLERIPVLSTTHTSIEEIASKVMTALGIQRQLF
ncbi:MAG TPA: pyruvate, water dikinase regulatory protein [Xanthomonadaceae bacterium]|nr:pyruvate, water dikinase regulatory protein [Xanthomonadaceae bacterium]